MLIKLRNKDLQGKGLDPKIFRIAAKNDQVEPKSK